MRDWTDSDGLSKCRDLWLSANFIKNSFDSEDKFPRYFSSFFFFQKIEIFIFSEIVSDEQSRSDRQSD